MEAEVDRGNYDEAGRQNPLMMEDILDKIFIHFEDPKNLTSFRQVNKVWNKAACRVIKKKLRWRIGPDEDSERDFVGVMLNSKDDLLRNFHFCHSVTTIDREGQEDAQADGMEIFLQNFGANIVDLQLSALTAEYVVNCLKPSFLPNLEYLELYDISEQVLKHLNLLEGIKFPKLTGLCFNSLLTDEDARETFDEGDAIVCFNCLKASPKLKELEINLPTTAGKVLASDINLEYLNNFKTAEADPPLVLLLAVDIDNMMTRCANLKSLSTCINSYVKENLIFELLLKFSNKLEELDLSIIDNYEWDSDDSSVGGSDNEDNEMNVPDEDVGNVLKRKLICATLHPAKKICRNSFPRFPILKKLRLKNWKVHNFCDFITNMPFLEYLDIQFSSSSQFSLPVVPPSLGHQNVSYLKFGLGGCTLARVSEEMISPLAKLFPKLIEFDVNLKDDGALRAVFQSMAQLKRLHLGCSDITDSGITGLHLQSNTKSILNSDDLALAAAAAEVRQFPFIGDLTGLQHLTYDGFGLTNASIRFGIILLPELTYFKKPPYRRGTHLNLNRWRISSLSFKATAVDVRFLVEHCRNLVRLDVNDPYFEDSEDEDWNELSENDDEFKKVSTGSGCGISDNDIQYITEQMPSLELVYAESLSLTDREEESLI